MTENYYSIEMTLRPEAVEAIEFAFNSLGAEGTASSFRKAGAVSEVTLSGYFTEPPADELVRDELSFALDSYGLSKDVVISSQSGWVVNEDWLAEWKKHWKPTRIGRFLVAPPWADVDEPDAIVIRIEPNMAFGTGTHETTQLCLSAIDRLYSAGDSFLDVGTGTGILAIAAAKLGDGSETVHGCDTDADSVQIARENAVLNEASEIEFFVGPIGPETPRADFVCANLTVDVIVPIADLLIEKTSKVLVLSGILGEQEPIIIDRLRSLGLDRPTVERAGEWISVTVTRSA